MNSNPWLAAVGDRRASGSAWSRSPGLGWSSLCGHRCDIRVGPEEWPQGLIYGSCPWQGQSGGPEPPCDRFPGGLFCWAASDPCVSCMPASAWGRPGHTSARGALTAYSPYLAEWTFLPVGTRGAPNVASAFQEQVLGTKGLPLGDEEGHRDLEMSRMRGPVGLRGSHRPIA